MKISKYLYRTFLFTFIFSAVIGCNENKKDDKKLEYRVSRLMDSITIDANWNKPQWQKVEALTITNIMGDKPKYFPQTKVKILYNNSNIYVIFHVKDKYVKAVATHINDNIYHDSTVEFFFTPSENISDGYYNLEVNCGGTPYFEHQTGFRKDIIKIDVEDIKKIEIAHSLPTIINPEIKELTEWTIEYKIPISILEKYSKVVKPAPDVTWKGNFYKTADETSNPHYITWNKVINETPNFHLPQFFGEINFQ